MQEHHLHSGSARIICMDSTLFLVCSPDRHGLKMGLVRPSSGEWANQTKDGLGRFLLNRGRRGETSLVSETAS